jgi:hypothetical protein
MRPPITQPESPAEQRGQRLIARIAALTAVAATAGLLLAPIPDRLLGVWQGQILDFGHVPLFAALVLALRVGMGSPLWRPLFAAIALAGLAEVVQPFVGRTGDWVDFLRGTLGALSAGAAIRAWESRRARVRACAYLALALALPVWPIIEITPYLTDEMTGRRAFPVLASFSTDHELLRWECEQATLTRGEPGCRVDFLTGPAEYSGVALRPIVCDFRDYRWLCCEFEVIGAPLELATSIRTGMNDPNRTTHTDIAQRCSGGHHIARLDLAAMAAQGRPEPLDLSDVRSVILFVVRPQESRTIVLTRVWLERG